MLKLIHSDFELDLSNYNISIIEENHWFSDTFFTKYTLPFSFHITDELNAAMGDLLSHASADATTYFKVYLYHNGQEHEAVFEIEEYEDREASGTVRYGLEELPNYDKKLSELPLDDFDIESPDTIYTHAESVISKTWPEVSHNFVQVHTDKFSEDDAQWAAFEKVLNKRVSGDFVENSYDAENDLQLNKNIMVPQPYFLHVLQKGIEDAGFTLSGDVLEDVELKKALFSEIPSYYYTVNTDAVFLKMHNKESISVATPQLGYFSKTIVLTEKGRYKISGNLNFRQLYARSSIDLKFNDNRIWYTVAKSYSGGFREWTYQIDINVDFFTGATATIECWSHQWIYGYVGGEYAPDDELPICDLTITQLSKLDANGDLLPTLITPNAVKLTKCVPDMTFGDFVKIIKNWRNLDLQPVDNVIFMNYIEKQLEVVNAKSLEDFEVKAPKREPSSGRSFLLKFQDINSEDYQYQEVYQDINGIFGNNIITEEDTSEIIINAVPLPIINRNGIITAHHFIDDTSRLKTLLYEGAPAIENLAENPEGLLIPATHENHYQDWFTFRINGKVYTWSFKMYEEQLRDLTIRDKVFAYSNHHIIKSLNKDLIRPGIWLVEIKTESLKHFIE